MPSDDLQAPAMKPYPTYKDSVLPWIGPIPAHWQTVPTFVALKEQQIPNTGLKEKTLLSLSYGRVIVKDIDSNFGLLPASFETYQIVKPGNIILRFTDLQNDHKSLRVGLAKNNGIITSAYLCLSVCKPLLPEYAYQQLHAIDTQKLFYSMGGGLRQSMGYADLRRMPIVMPPADEQAAIVAYLDRKTADIERFITKKRQLIALLNEQKAAIINQAVTKGLNPNAPTKASGVEWLGEIPAHWEVKRLKFTAVTNPSKNVTDYDTAAQDTVVFLPMENISTDGRIDCSIHKPLEEVRQGFTFFGRGDIVIAKITPCFENGKGAWLSTLDTVIGYGTTELIVLRPLPNIMPQFLYNVTISSSFRTQGAAAMTGSAGQQRVPTDFVRDYPVTLPPSLDEQAAIVAHIGSESAVINQAITHIQREIDLIHEYRTTLISHAVTGKIDVRDAPHAIPILTT